VSSKTEPGNAPDGVLAPELGPLPALGVMLGCGRSTSSSHADSGRLVDLALWVLSRGAFESENPKGVLKAESPL